MNYRNISQRFTNYLTVGGSLCMSCPEEEDSMIIRSPEPEVKILVDRDPVKLLSRNGPNRVISQEQ